MISLKYMNSILHCSSSEVTVEGGALFSDVNVYLEIRGLRLPNLSSIVEQSVAGAIATSTHGTLLLLQEMCGLRCFRFSR